MSPSTHGSACWIYIFRWTMHLWAPYQNKLYYCVHCSLKVQVLCAWDCTGHKCWPQSYMVAWIRLNSLELHYTLVAHEYDNKNKNKNNNNNNNNNTKIIAMESWLWKQQQTTTTNLLMQFVLPFPSMPTWPIRQGPHVCWGVSSEHSSLPRLLHPAAMVQSERNRLEGIFAYSTDDISTYYDYNSSLNIPQGTHTLQ